MRLGKFSRKAGGSQNTPKSENRAGSNEITTFSGIVAKKHDPEKGENVVISLLSARFS